VEVLVVPEVVVVVMEVDVVVEVVVLGGRGGVGWCLRRRWRMWCRKKAYVDVVVMEEVEVQVDVV